MQGSKWRKIAIGLGCLLGVLLLGASSASAFPLSASPAGNITSTGAAFTVEGPLGVDVVCDVTMTGSLARSVRSAGGSVGSITNVDVANCNYPVTPLDGTAWPITAQGLLESGSVLNGVLNRISGIGFLAEDLPLAGDCLFSGVIDFLIALASNGRSGVIRTLASRLSSTCALITGNVVAGQTFSLSPQQVITRS